MNHPEALLVPASMLIDYGLTVAGRRLSGEYAAHFKKPHYELNPLWQKAVEQQKWFNPRHLALTGIVGCACLLVGALLGPHDPLAAGFFGCVLGMFALIIGRHLGNIALFLYVRRHPEQITGVVTMSHELILWLSILQLAPVALTLLLISMIAPTPQTSGAIVGMGLLAVVHWRWLRHQRRLANSEALKVSSADEAARLNT